MFKPTKRLVATAGTLVCSLVNDFRVPGYIHSTTCCKRAIATHLQATGCLKAQQGLQRLHCLAAQIPAATGLEMVVRSTKCMEPCWFHAETLLQCTSYCL
eukprot:GHRR01019843.1.p1 GENE.GHRR01019843.1~~GHRR01019843.1.p1  ORF type:complete len:100 (-),score=20.36 GHRR01019843.1:386-685(-)